MSASPAEAGIVQAHYRRRGQAETNMGGAAVFVPFRATKLDV